MPTNNQITRRIQSGYILNEHLPLEIIDKIWKIFERAQDAAARGRRKMYMWAMYKFSFTEYLADLRLTSSESNRLHAYRRFLARCLREGR